MTQMDADEKYEAGDTGIPWYGQPSRQTGFMHFAVPATSPVTAGRTVPPDFRQCEGLGVDSRKQTDAV